MKTFILPDLHGHYVTLFNLLLEAGVIDDDGNRQDGWRVISIGDLANCTEDGVDDDLANLKQVGEWIDTLLIGNHEHPYFGGPEFRGFERYPEIAKELNRIDREGHLAPAALVSVPSEEGGVDDILVTHAGYVPTEGIESALDGFNYAVESWLEDKKHPLFSQIGVSRGGWSRNGGILWSGWEEKKAHEFNQIVGHTPQREGVQRRDYESTGKWSLCIDVGAKVGLGATGVYINGRDMSFVSVPMSGNHTFNALTGKWE